MLIHHGSSRGARGWSGLRAAADTEIEIKKGEKVRIATLSKQKDGADGVQWGFRLDTVIIGEDDDGEDVTSCAYIQEDVPSGTKNGRKMGKWEEKIINIFNEFYSEPDNLLVKQEAIICCAVDRTAFDPKKERPSA